MEKETKDLWRNISIILIILIITCILIIISQTQKYNRMVVDYRNNYDYKCQEGTTKQCLSSDQQLSYCKNTDSQLCYDYRLQTAITCNSAERLIASCIPNDYTKWASCSSSETARCLPTNSVAGYCEKTESLQCLSKDRWAVWTGDYMSTCPIGKTASCN